MSSIGLFKQIERLTNKLEETKAHVLVLTKELEKEQMSNEKLRRKIAFLESGFRYEGKSI